MRLVPLLFILIGCGKPAAAPAQGIRGRVVRVDEEDREIGPAAGVRVRGTASARVAGEEKPREAALGPAPVGPDGRFEIPLPEPIASARGARATWTWTVRLEVEDDEVLGSPPLDLKQTDPLEGVVLRIERADPDLPARVRKRFEDLRASTARSAYRYGMDIGSLIGNDDLLLRLSNCASTSRTALRILKEYEKDRDENLRALAYELLAREKKSEDEAGRPAEADDPDSARRLLRWAFHAVSSSKHGGHLELGVDLDDLCSRCHSVYEDAVSAAHVLGPEATKAALDAIPAREKQAAVLRRLVLEELATAARVRTRERELLEARPDFDLPPGIDGEAILVPETFALKLVRPERDARPVALNPRWLDFSLQDLSGNGSRILGVETRYDDLWSLDLSTGRGSRIGWNGMDHHQARWLKDGVRAAFIRIDDPRRELRLLDTRTGTSNLLFEWKGFMGGLAVDPAGKRAVVTISDGQEKHAVELIDLATGKVERFLEGGASEGPIWSADGGRLAMVRKQSLEVIDVATREVRPVARLLSHRAPFAWSPDGGRLAYVEFPAWEDTRGRGRLMLASLDGSAPKALATFESELGAYAPAWSPDGRRLAFVAPKDRSAWVHIVAADASMLFPVCEAGSFEHQVSSRSLFWRAAPK